MPLGKSIDLTTDSGFSAANWIFICSQLVIVLALALVASSEAMQAYKKRQRSLAHLSGARVRLWFLGLLTLGLVLRFIVELAIVVSATIYQFNFTRFTVSLGHCIPSLAFLSSYSMAAAFLAGVCQSSSTTEAPLLTPFLVGSNALLYATFLSVTSITKVKHAHREFRMSAFCLLGISHCILAVVWTVFGLRAALKVKRRQDLSDRSIAASSCRANWSCCSFNSITTDQSLKTFHTLTTPDEENVVRLCVDASWPPGPQTQLCLSPLRSAVSGRTSLLIRLIILAVFCPPTFTANGFIELSFASRLWEIRSQTGSSAQSIPADYCTTWSFTNGMFFASQMLPVILILGACCPRDLPAKWQPSPRRNAPQAIKLLQDFFGIKQPDSQDSSPSMLRERLL